MTHVQVYDIESGVPVPVGRSVLLKSLEVGDSVLFPLSKRSSIQQAAWYLRKTQGKTFTVKKMDDNNARVWRVK